MAGRRGFKYSVATGTPELTVEVDGAERVAMDATGISFLGTAVPAALGDTTAGNISTYNRDVFKAMLTQLAALGVIVDSTTN